MLVEMPPGNQGSNKQKKKNKQGAQNTDNKMQVSHS
jgi:hypothetical protein